LDTPADGFDAGGRRGDCRLRRRSRSRRPARRRTGERALRVERADLRVRRRELEPGSHHAGARPHRHRTGPRRGAGAHGAVRRQHAVPLPERGDPQADTWQWDGHQWTQIPTAATPGRRSGYGLAFDAARARVVLHGGNESLYPTSVFVIRTDTWELDGTRRSQVAPALGYSGVLVPDESTGSVAMLAVRPGSRGGPVVARTDRSGTAWQTLPAQELPPGSEYIVYDSVRDRLVVHDARPSSPVPNTTWEWDGGAFLDRQPAPVPPGRQGGAFALDVVRGQADLHGGSGGPGGAGLLADT
jgi:hypothetical protein